MDPFYFLPYREVLTKWKHTECFWNKSKHYETGFDYAGQFNHNQMYTFFHPVLVWVADSGLLLVILEVHSLLFWCSQCQQMSFEKFFPNKTWLLRIIHFLPNKEACICSRMSQRKGKQWKMSSGRVTTRQTAECRSCVFWRSTRHHFLQGPLYLTEGRRVYCWCLQNSRWINSTTGEGKFSWFEIMSIWFLSVIERCVFTSNSLVFQFKQHIQTESECLFNRL